jgi:hypothetical protein
MHDGSLQSVLERVRAAEQAGQGALAALPLRLTVELTADCNLRCPHCEFTPPRALAEKQGLKPMLHLPLKDLDWLAHAVFPEVCEVIPSVVGEPMMYPFWDEFLAHCATHGVFVDVVNGTYLTPERLERPPGVLEAVRLDGRRPAEDHHVARLTSTTPWRACARSPSGAKLRRMSATVASIHRDGAADRRAPAMVRWPTSPRRRPRRAHVVAYNEHRGPNLRHQPKHSDDVPRGRGRGAAPGLSLHLPLHDRREPLGRRTAGVPAEAEGRAPSIPTDGRPTFASTSGARPS